jgi:hypothetical protein
MQDAAKVIRWKFHDAQTLHKVLHKININYGSERTT